MHLVSWPKVCKEKKFGGLGIRRLEILNRVLENGYGGLLKLVMEVFS